MQRAARVNHTDIQAKTGCKGPDFIHLAYGLGPISVWPEYQRQGIGKSFIHEGWAVLKSLGAEGCVLVGDPTDDQRFGFGNQPKLRYEGVPQ